MTVRVYSSGLECVQNDKLTCALERPLLNEDLIGAPPKSIKKSLVVDGAATWLELEFI